jgi:tRNA U38,U39,U40 pseudouridine synthase TruA
MREHYEIDADKHENVISILEGGNELISKITQQIESLQTWIERTAVYNNTESEQIDVTDAVAELKRLEERIAAVQKHISYIQGTEAARESFEELSRRLVEKKEELRAVVRAMNPGSNRTLEHTDFVAFGRLRDEIENVVASLDSVVNRLSERLAK